MCRDSNKNKRKGSEMQTAIAAQTEQVLADMLTENTGAHMLDSGGAYGRHWERNAGKTVQDFLSAPEVQVSEHGLNLDLFHYLRHRLEYVPEIDQRFSEFCEAPEQKDESYFSCAYAWCEEHGDADGIVFSGNTCNGEHLLSQEFQAEAFWNADDGETYILLSIHGGCDVRGGYTKPRVFRPYESFGWDANSVSLYVEKENSENISLDYRDGEITDIETGTYLSRDDDLSNYFQVWWQPDDGENYPTWDADKAAWLSPDGDGYLVFDPPCAY